MADSSFDIVSKVDRQEVDNALNQAAKEIAQRYDFKNVGASIAWSGEADRHEGRTPRSGCKAVLDVFQEKLIKRGISLKALDAGEPQASGKEYRVDATLKQGISQENAKKIAKIIRDEGPKSVKAQIQGDELRVSSQEPRRPAGRHRPAQGQDLDFAAPVRQLPLSRIAAERPSSGSGAGSRR